MFPECEFPSHSEIPHKMSLTAFATEILKHAQILDAYIEEHSLPQPSFDKTGPLLFPISNNAAAQQESRTLLLEASQAISDLVAGPVNSIGWSALSVNFPSPHQMCSRG
jgi:hypothetical protein